MFIDKHTMKDELIDAINRKIEQNKRLTTVSVFSLAGINFLLTLLVTHFKYPKFINIKDATLIKNFFWGFS